MNRSVNEDVACARFIALKLVGLGILHLTISVIFAPYVPQNGSREAVIASIAMLSVPYFCYAGVLLVDHHATDVASRVLITFSVIILLTLPGYTFIRICRVSHCLRPLDPLSMLIKVYTYCSIILICLLTCMQRRFCLLFL